MKLSTFNFKRTLDFNSKKAATYFSNVPLRYQSSTAALWEELSASAPGVCPCHHPHLERVPAAVWS